MGKSRKSQKNTLSKSGKRTRTFKRSRFPPKRSMVVRGGGLGSTPFPSTISNSDVVASPQSYLPYNNFSNDPGYSVIAARNTGPFLTGVSKGGKKGNKNGSRRMRGSKKVYGGSNVSATISNGLNTATNSVGLISAPALNETSGVAGVMSQFSGNGSAYSSTPLNIAPLA